MNKIERVRAALAGEEVDHAPVSFWGHYLDHESTAEELAESMVTSFRRLDYDYLKNHARASYHMEDWGSVFAPSVDGVAFPTVTNAVIESTDDWKRLPVLDPEKGSLGEQLEALRLINQELKDEALFIQTVFSPLSIARTLVGGDPAVLHAHMEEDPEAFKQGLSTIAKTFAPYMSLCLDQGAAGFFYGASYGASRDHMTKEQYREFGVPYDLEVLEPTKGRAEFNMLHLCKSNIEFDLVNEYPVQCVNWSDWEVGNPSLAEALQRTDKAVVGGLGEKTTLQGPEDAVVAEAISALEQTGGRRHLLGGGCSLQTKITPESNLIAARQTAIEWAQNN